MPGSNTRRRYITIGTFIITVVGILIGVPLSYYFQPDIVQSKLTLTEYLTRLGEVVTSEQGDFISPIILSCFLSGFLFGTLGYIVIRNAAPEEKAGS